MLFSGGYYSLKYYIFTQLNSKLPTKIQFDDLSLSIFPLAIQVKNIYEFPIKDNNLISFKKVSVEIPFFSLLSKIKSINVYIHEPKVIFDDTLLKKGDKKTSFGEFKINKINIIDGELIYSTPKLTVNLLKFNLLTFPKADYTVFRLTSPHLKAIFPFSREQVTYEGQMLAEFRQQGQNWRIIKFNWQTQQALVNVNGNIYRDGRAALNTYAQGSFRQVLDPLLEEFSIHEFMYGDFKIKRGKDGRLSVNGNAHTGHFTFRGLSFKDLTAEIGWDSVSTRVRVNAGFLDRDKKIVIRVEALGKEVKILAENAPAADAGRIIDIYDIIPMAGTIKKAEFTLADRIVAGTAEIEPIPGNAGPNEFNAGGNVQFTYHTKDKIAQVTTAEIQTEFGKITDITVTATPNQKKQLVIDLKAEITESAYLNKYSTFFINLPLDQWKLKKGKGSGKLHLEKIKEDFFIKADLNLGNVTSCGENIAALKGHVETDGHITRGDFTVADPDLNGEAKLYLDSGKGDYNIHFNNLRGESQKMLNLLEIDLDLAGRARGNFVYSNNIDKPAPFLTGSFEADNARFYAFQFENTRGRLDYEENTDTLTIHIDKTGYMTGEGSAQLVIDYKKEQFKANGKITGLDFNRMNVHFTGKGDVAFSGQGGFEQDPISITYQTGDIYFYRDQFFRVKGEGKLLTNFSDHYYLEADGEILSNNTPSPVSLRLNQVNGKYDGKFQGNIKDINLLIPWGDNQGQIDVEGRIFNRENDEMGIQGHAEFKGKYLSFPNFAHTLDNFSGDLLFNDLNFTLRSLQGTIGGGKVNGGGSLIIKENRLDSLLLRLSGKSTTLNIIDRTSFVMDSDLTLNYREEKLLLSGELNILSGVWEREVDEGVQFYTDPSLSASGSSLLDVLEYDLKITSKRNILARNSLGEVTGRLNLRLGGDYNFPTLTGTIETRKGFINFSGKKFDLVKGKLVFKNRIPTDPEIDIEAEAYIKNYRIKFTIKGLSSKMNPDLQSSPPLPPRDIFTLIAVGELFKRPTSEELINQLGGGTTSLIASELTEQIKKRTKKLFGDYLLRIDPNISSISGAYDSSRLIVGKEISKDFLIVYSTNFSTQRQQVVYVQYQLSPNISLIGMRNEEGRFSLDLRFRKRK